MVNWISYSLLMFFSSVGLYVAVRKSTLLKIPAQLNNLAMFGVPLIVYLIIGTVSKTNYHLSFIQALIIFIIAVFFSYLGNIFSLLSIEYAPNPGYSLVLSKSYVLLTTIVAVLLFHAQLSLQKMVAIVIIIGFSSLIVIDPKKVKKTAKRLWLPLAIGAFFCWGLLSLFSKYLFSQGLNVLVYLIYIELIVTGCIIGEIFIKKVPLKYLKNNFIIILTIGILSSSFNLFMMEAIKIAPNIGYVNAINASSISLVTVFSIILFKDEFSIKKFIGILGITIGLLFLLI